MRNFYLSVFVLAIAACTNTIEENVPSPSLAAASAKAERCVSYADVLKLAQCQKSSTRADGTLCEVECITGKQKDTLLFVCKKPEGGWVIYSSDTRVPPIVAESGSGSFDKLMEIDGARLWIEAMAEDMAVIKSSSDKEIKFSKEEIENNKNFWKSISSIDVLLKENQTRADVDPIDLPPYPGHYELILSESHEEIFDSIPDLIETHWHQWSPLNIYCPLKSNNIGHVPAGCVAIAGAQMLYFLHNKLSVPTLAPSQAYCIGNVSNYSSYQYNFTSDIWADMPKYAYDEDSIAAAPLVANVGSLLDMNYGDDRSGAHTEDLVDDVFCPYGIDCEYLDYDDPFNRGLLGISLLNKMPVILSARAIVPEGEKEGHAFIAVRYKRTRTVTRNYYEWIYDELPPFTRVPLVTPRIEYTYSTPYVAFIGMNWGWGLLYENRSEWFNLTGDWIPSRATQYNWNISRHMILGFHPINN